ncbi:unnamed protein product [Penicillium roqueforti FM164]|uniref:Genomic scaffold, ProqFM164S01 n=1 Tax=Penicillium roqueforti (strain FM164) TaxID=1365484 RepID=W6Q2G7_PENRF|nr:unnamed protein product [Penicillium roqueforti FM164]
MLALMTSMITGSPSTLGTEKNTEIETKSHQTSDSNKYSIQDTTISIPYQLM